MAIGLTTVKTTGKLVFELERDDEQTTRTIDVPFPKTDTTDQEAAAALQTAINSINASLTSDENARNIMIQPANWRDDNDTEKQWTTTRVYYEISTVTSTPIEPETE